MSEPITILQILPSLESGGVERGTIEIAAAIKKAGMRPIVVSAGGALVPHVLHAGAEHFTLPVNRKNLFIMWRNIGAMEKLIREQNVRIVHARSRVPAWSAYFATKRANVPFMTTFHGMYGAKSKLKKYYSGIMARGQRIIAISQFIREYAIHKFEANPDIIRTIPRGVDFAIFDDKRIVPERLAQLTKNWRLPDEAVPIIFCPGRISRIKGQHVLIAALEKLKNQPFLCIIAGKDDGHEQYRQSLERQIVAAGLEGKVRLVAPTNAMTEAYMLSDVVVVPSSQPEAFGRVAIEAQAMGKIVVATDHGGARETILPNETGYLVPPEDPQAMAEAIQFALARDANTVIAMADFARQHVRTHFTTEQMQQATLAVYRELLKA